MLLIGKPSINGPFSMAMLNNQRVNIYITLLCQDLHSFFESRQAPYDKYTIQTIAKNHRARPRGPHQGAYLFKGTSQALLLYS